MVAAFCPVPCRSCVCYLAEQGLPSDILGALWCQEVMPGTAHPFHWVCVRQAALAWGEKRGIGEPSSLASSLTPAFLSFPAPAPVSRILSLHGKGMKMPIL